MKIVLYGRDSDRSEFSRSILSLPGGCYRKISVDGYSDYDSFITGLGGSPPDLIIIAMDGADGMEGVIAARNVCGDIPIIWFSDDGGFGVQSYRLGCAYFHEKPISPQVLSAAFDKCV